MNDELRLKFASRGHGLYFDLHMLIDIFDREIDPRRISDWNAGLEEFMSGFEQWARYAAHHLNKEQSAEDAAA